MANLLFNLVSISQPAKNGEGNRNVSMIQFPEWLGSNGQSVSLPVRDFRKSVDVLLAMVDTPEEISSEVSPKALSKLTSEIPGLGIFLDEQETSPAEFWCSLASELGSEDESDPAGRFYSLIAGSVPVEKMGNLDLNNLLSDFTEKKMDEVRKMKESYGLFQQDTFSAWMKEKIAKNGLRSETIKVKGEDGKKVETVVNYVRVKAAKK